MTVIYRHDEWDAQRTTVRLCSALLAAGVTLLLILALSRPLGIIKTSDTFVHPVSAMLLQFPLNIRPAVDAAKDTPESVNVPVSATGNTANDSVPLDISQQSIARAYQASKSELQQRAEASGKTLENAAPGKYERLQKDLQQATIPGCADDDALKHRPAKIGGVSFIGLLAAPFWAQAVISRKCR
jgi:hypothetical protein